MFQLLLVVIYLAFISLGLPDSLLGSAWPVMYRQFEVPVSYAGMVSMIIAAGTIISSLQSDRLTRKLGVGRVTALSVAVSAVSLFGFSMSTAFWQLCVLALPYGLAAGSVDAALNNYVALHYSGSQMSWLHCMWGIGASAGPYVMGYALSSGRTWNSGYRYIGICQTVLMLIVLLSLPLWKERKKAEPGSGEAEQDRALSLREIVKIPGAKEIMVSFFCYCTVEQTAILWASSYLVMNRGSGAEQAAKWASMFCLGITFGRAVSGFVAMKLNDTQMIRLGQAIIAAGVVLLLLPLGRYGALAAFLLIGLGCAPIYPCIIHSTPAHFGADKSQALVGVQMASAYTGTCLMPPLFGVLANAWNISLLPVYLLIVLVVMAVMHERLLKKTEGR